MFYKGDIVEVNSIRGQLRATVVAHIGYISYEVKYENGEVGDTRHDLMKLIKGGAQRRRETGK